MRDIRSRLNGMRSRFPALFGLRLRRAKSLHFVTLNGHRFKRMQVADTRIAADIERHLQVFQADGIFPDLITRYEHELWVDFIPGARPEQVTERFVRHVADFYAVIYTKRATLEETATTAFPGRLARDLRFLHRVGVLTGARYAQLCRAAERRVPQRVWIGFDYTDPVLKNFVVSREGERLYAVDVEGIADHRLIGMGTVKASVRWLGDFKPLFYEHLAARGTPDFQSYLSFVELCFLAQWTKRNYFEGKTKKIRPGLFDPFCEEE